MSSLERAASFGLGSFFALLAVRDLRVPVRASAFGFVSFAFFRRALTGHSRVYSSFGVATAPEGFLPTALATVREPQRTVTMRASLEEIEIFFLDPPRLAGYELGRDFEVFFIFRPAPFAGTEVQARLLKWPSGLTSEDADRLLREFLREAKQFIETGEVARVDHRVHGRRSRWLSLKTPSTTPEAAT